MIRGVPSGYRVNFGSVGRFWVVCFKSIRGLSGRFQVKYVSHQFIGSVLNRPINEKMRPTITLLGHRIPCFRGLLGIKGVLLSGLSISRNLFRQRPILLMMLSPLFTQSVLHTLMFSFHLKFPYRSRSLLSSCTMASFLAS